MRSNLAMKRVLHPVGPGNGAGHGAGHGAEDPAGTRRRRAVAVLELDPDLAREMDPERAAAARSAAVAAIETVPPGEWPAETLNFIEPYGALGLLLIDGLMAREVHVAGASFTELIGEGEILRPWENGTDTPAQTARVVWNVMEPTRIALLDRGFVARVARWPEISVALVGRAVRRSRALSVQLAICNMPRVESRLLLLLWHLADRWGRVTTDGVVLPLGLTHRTLACLVGARRPTVTTALKQLSGRRRLSRRADGSWVLHGERPDELGQLYATIG
jgi:hypothetical protein